MSCAARRVMVGIKAMAMGTRLMGTGMVQVQRVIRLIQRGSQRHLLSSGRPAINAEDLLSSNSGKRSALRHCMQKKTKLSPRSRPLSSRAGSGSTKGRRQRLRKPNGHWPRPCKQRRVTREPCRRTRIHIYTGCCGGAWAAMLLRMRMLLLLRLLPRMLLLLLLLMLLLQMLRMR